jgi:hypothetical protein
MAKAKDVTIFSHMEETWRPELFADKRAGWVDAFTEETVVPAVLWKKFQIAEAEYKKLYAKIMNHFPRS